MSLRKDPSSVGIRDVLLEMRRSRMGLIQTADQLRFSYLAVIEGAKYIKGDASLQVQLSSLFCSFFFNVQISVFSNKGSFIKKHIFLFRSHGKSCQMRKMILQSSTLLLLFLLPETPTMAKSSHLLSLKM